MTHIHPAKISDKAQRKRLPRACRDLGRCLKKLAALQPKSPGATTLRNWAVQLNAFALQLPVTAIQDFAYLAYQALAVCNTVTKGDHSSMPDALDKTFCLARESGIADSDLDWFKSHRAKPWHN